MMITKQQEKFIWLAHAEIKSFAYIEKELNVSRATLSQWERDLRTKWQEVAAIRKIYKQKKIIVDLKLFYDWFIIKQKEKKCCYCHITEPEIKIMLDSKKIQTKRGRGKKLELDRKEPNSTYDDLENIEYACYWCNQSKTDTFTHEEFLEIGKSISKVWKQRMTK